MTPKRKEEMIVWGSVIGGVAILYVVFIPHSTAHVNTPNQKHPGVTRIPPQRITSSHPTMEPNPQQGSLDAAFLAARDQAIQSYDQTILGEKTAYDQLQAMNNETQAQKVIAFNTNATQLKEAGIASTTMRDVAGTQASAEENIASQEASAMGQYEHSQQQQSFWGGIMQFFQGALGFLGFNNPYANPVSYGTGQVYYDQNTGQQIPAPYYEITGDPYSWDYTQPPQVQVPSNITIGG